MSQRNCLLCYHICDGSNLNELIGQPQNVENSIVNEQVAVVFILRKLLDIPASFCQGLLSANGNPSNWINCCQSCSDLITKAHRIFKEMKLLEKDYESFKSEIRHVLDTSKDDQSSIGSNLAIVSDATDEIRKFALGEMGQVFNDVQDCDVVELEEFFVNCGDDEVVDESFGPSKQKELKEEKDSRSRPLRKASQSSNIIWDEDADDEVGSDWNGEEVEDVEDSDFSEAEEKRKSETKTKAAQSTNMTGDGENAKDEDGSDSSGEEEADEDCEDSDFFEGEEMKSKRKKRMVKADSSQNKMEHEGKKDFHFQCKKCEKKFPFWNQLKKHYIAAHPEFPSLATTRTEKRRVCDICEKVFRRHADLKDHRRGYHYQELGLEPFECKECGKIFKNKTSVKSHMLNFHQKSVSVFCSLCNEGFFKKNHLDSHMVRDHGRAIPFSFSCDQCPKSFCTSDSLKNHIIVYHTKDFPYFCDICNKGEVSQARLKKHLQSHSGERKFTCEICGSAYKDEYALKKHQLAKHYEELKLNEKSEKPLKKITCEFCGKVFASNSALKYHILRHTKDYKFACHLCDKKCRSGYALEIHIRVHHTREKPFQCPICDETFFSSKSLNIHDQKHTGFKFKCEICGKGLQDNFRFNRHMACHKPNVKSLRKRKSNSK